MHPSKTFYVCSYNVGLFGLNCWIRALIAGLKLTETTLFIAVAGMSRSKDEQLRAVWRDDSSWSELKELLPEVSQIPVVPIDWDLLPSHLMVIEVCCCSTETFVEHGIGCRGLPAQNLKLKWLSYSTHLYMWIRPSAN